jgi:hypothetical protein
MHFSALVVQRRVTSANGNPVWEDGALPYRIHTVTGVASSQEVPSGFTEASFVIPTERARIDPELLAKNTLVWLFDGDDPVFYGHIVKATPLPTGEITVALNGAYRKLGPGPDDGTRMRIVWDDRDLSQWQPCRGNTGKGSVDVRSDGSLRFVMQGDTKHKDGDFVAVDYFLFGEGAGPRDHKLIDAVHFEQNVSNFADGNFAFRVYGMDDPSSFGTADLIFASQANSPIGWTTVSDGSIGDDPNGWPIQSGYRCIRVGLWCNNTVTLGQDAQGNPNNDDEDRVVGVSVLRVSTRGRSLRLLIDGHETSTFLKDLWDDAANGYDIHHLLQEEYIPSTGEAIVGGIEPSNRYVAGLRFTDWTAPNQIVELLADVSGYVTGMWFPTRVYTIGSHVTSGSSGWNYRYRQPPALIHEPWPKLNEPTYYVRLQRGASWVPDGQGDSTTEATYTNYSTLRGRQASVFVEDQTDENWLYQQGWHDAADWTIDTPVGGQTASTLAAEYNEARQQPTLSGTLTIAGDTIGSIVGSGGERITKLSTIRVGSVIKIVDAKGPKAGRITHVDYTARSAAGPETVVLTVNAPTGARLQRRLARMALRAEQNL